ncbi:MAG: hypothetical protein K1X74_21145 [Pirellulales bacterium]|nr:hypothetical protein [Pirellulales bacterium]
MDPRDANQQTPSSPHRLGPKLLAAAVLFVAALVVHLPALPGGFFWDDYDWVVNNPKVCADEGLYQLWFTWNQGDYWPMHYSTHWFEWRVWGEWALPYRVLNQLFHAANGVLLWLLFARLRVPGAWWAALIFVVHPVNVESVVWISQRKTVQSTAGVLLALWCYLDFLERGGARWYLAAWGCFLLGLLTKSAVVMWPLAMLIVVAWWRGRIVPRDAWLCLPWFLTSAWFGAVGMLMKQKQPGIEWARDDTFFERLLIAGKAVWFYAAKAVWPHPLAVVYPRWELGQIDALGVIAVASLVGLLIASWLARRTWGAAPLTAMGYYLVNLFPVLGFTEIMFMRYSLVADHWQYLALPGLLALLVGGAVLLGRELRLPRPLRIACGGAVVGVLALLAWRQSAAWATEDHVPIWRESLAINPQSELPNLRLGYALARRREMVEAVERICQAARYSVPPLPWGNAPIQEDVWLTIRREPWYAQAQGVDDPALRVALALGTAYLVMNQAGLALAPLQQVAQAAPESPVAHYNLAIALQRLGRAAEAQVEFARARQLAKTSAQPRK